MKASTIWNHIIRFYDHVKQSKNLKFRDRGRGYGKYCHSEKCKTVNRFKCVQFFFSGREDAMATEGHELAQPSIEWSQKDK